MVGPHFGRITNAANNVSCGDHTRTKSSNGNIKVAHRKANRVGSSFVRTSIILAVILSSTFSLVITTAITDAQWHRLALQHAHLGTITSDSGLSNASPVPLHISDMTFGDRIANLARLLLTRGSDLPPIALTFSTGNQAMISIVDQHQFQTALRWLSSTYLITMIGVMSLLSISLIRFDHRTMVKPSRDMIDVINAFSHDPTTARPIPDSLRHVPNFAAAGKAIEELQQNTLLALRQRERLADIGEAVAKISHDIRNALSSATLMTEALLSSPDKRVRKSAPYVVQSLEQAVEMCQSMLDYLSEHPSAKRERIDVTRLAEDLSTHSKIEVVASGANIIYADHQFMTRILLNLMRNAAHAGATRISIDIWRVGHLAVIDISDDGPGIAPEYWPELFMAFKSHQSSGSGLGLAIARDLVVAQGGSLKLSRSTNAGSEFRIQLPARVLNNADA